MIERSFQEFPRFVPHGSRVNCKSEESNRFPYVREFFMVSATSTRGRLCVQIGNFQCNRILSFSFSRNEIHGCKFAWDGQPARERERVQGRRFYTKFCERMSDRGWN